MGTTVTQMQDSFEGDTSPSTEMEKIAEVVDLGELFADRARVRDDPGMRARSRRTNLKSRLDREELFPIELDMDQRGPPGQRKSPKFQSQKRDWYSSARVQDATAEFPQILARGSELKGECDESGSTIIAPLVISTRGLYWLTNYVNSMCCLGTCCDFTI